jgi:Cys-tRNA(Pro)/Cys-tRNA(Cys) deacylase
VRRGDDDFLLVLVPGTRQIDWPKLRAHLGVSRLSMPDAEVAREVTGYERGTITPFGASRPWPVLADASIAGVGTVTVGGGAHGVSLRLDADELLRAVDAELVDLT